jgi:hypothetical protein
VVLEALTANVWLPGALLYCVALKVIADVLRVRVPPPVAVLPVTVRTTGTLTGVLAAPVAVTVTDPV